MKSDNRDRIRAVLDLVYARARLDLDSEYPEERTVTMTYDDWCIVVDALEKPLLPPARKSSIEADFACYLDVVKALERARINGSPITEKVAIARMAARHGKSTRRKYYAVKRIFDFANEYAKSVKSE